MDHGPAVQWGEDKAADYKSRIGLVFFVVYTFCYAVFIAINVVSPKTMGTIVMAGLNLAVVYGFALILLAFVLGLVYNTMCTKKEDQLSVKVEE